MFKLVYELEKFESKFALPQGSLYSQDCIIDLCLMNNIAPKWDYSEGIPWMVGVLHGKLLGIYVSESRTDPLFKSELWQSLTNIAQESQLYALNYLFVKKVLKTLFDGFEFPILELSPINGKGWTRDSRYNILREKGVLTGDKEIIDIFGAKDLSVQYYARWNTDGNNQAMLDACQHLFSMMLKDALIHNYRSWFRKHFELDERGFEKHAK